MGNGSLRIAQGNVYGQRLQQFSVQFQGNGDALTTALNVETAAGSAKANLVFHPKDKGYELQLDAPGIKLAQVQPVQETDLGIDGILTATARGRGTLDNPQLAATVEIPQLHIRQASISGIKAELNLANQKAQLALDSEVAQSFVQARGSLELTGGHYMHASFDTKGMPIEGLLALYAPAKTNGPHGILEVHVSADGPLSDKTRMQAQVVIPTLKADKVCRSGIHVLFAYAMRIRSSQSIRRKLPEPILAYDCKVSCHSKAMRP